MNQWKAEELAQLAYAEWQRKLAADHVQLDYNAVEMRASFTSRAALRISDWLIASGERLRQRHEKSATLQPWAYNKKFVR